MLKVKTLKKITKKIESVPGTDKNFDLIVNKVYEEINAKNLSDDDREVVVEWWAFKSLSNYAYRYIITSGEYFLKFFKIFLNN